VTEHSPADSTNAMSPASVGTDRLLLDLVARQGQPLAGAQLGLTGDRSWNLADRPPFALEIDGQDISGDLLVREVEATRTDESEHLRIDLASPSGVEVTAHYSASAGQGIITACLQVSAEHAANVTRVEPFRLELAGTTFGSLQTVAGVQQQGGWRPMEGMYRSFRQESHPLTNDTEVVTASGERSTWWETPWGALTGENVDGGILLALDYGAQWELRATSNGATLLPTGIVPEIEPGKPWTSPTTWLGAWSGDLDDAAAVMHRYLRDIVMPATDDDFPWVQYNTWFSWYCELEEDILLAEADLAARIGVEVFYVDAGWWVGNPQRRDRFSSGLGNWRENRDKFPRGLKAFADDIRARGMHFGLWVEPERVDMRTATTGTWQPDWIAREQDGTYVRCPWPSDTDTAWLCFGDSRAQDWATEWISDLVADLGIRWLKWDSNYWDVCHSTDHGHGAGDGEAAQVAGVQAVMARLRDRFPDLVIENCAGGATRMDFSLAHQTPAAWLNDASEPAHRSRFHNYGASYLFPPEMLNAWVTESEYENVNGQNLPDDVWRMTIRSRMLGAMGFSCRLQTWSEQTLAVAREEVTRYQQEWRPLMVGGTFRHLLPQPEIPSAELPTPDVWEAYQVTAADGQRHAILGFRNVSPDATQRVHPGGIDATATYEVTPERGDRQIVPGPELIANGLPLTAPLLASEWVSLRVVS
jgi:alpha-galactosidase